VNTLILAQFRGFVRGSRFALQQRESDRTMKAEWTIVVATGLIAGMIRMLGPALMADLAAITYLILATVVFSRTRHANARP
jgi:hypothetical protein